MKNLILATESIPRRRAFDELNILYTTMESHINEYFEGRPTTPEELVLCLAKLKAEKIYEKVSNTDSIIIGFDSVGYFEGKILEKVKSKKESIEKLQKISGKSYKYFTGIHLIDNKYTESRVVETEAIVRNLSDNEIQKYLREDPDHYKYAPGFNPLETFGCSFIKEIHGSVNNILRGMPLEIIVEMLIERGFEIK